MKFFLAMLMVLSFALPIMAGGTFTVTETQYVVVSGNTSDTLGREMLTPDSMRIVVTDSAGTELFDAWFENADAQCALNGDVITFFDQWEDIDGAASTGVFSLMVTIASNENSVEVFSNQSYVIVGVDESVEQTYNEVGDIFDDVANLGGWTPILDNDSLIVDQSTLEDMTVATVTDVTNQVTADVTGISGSADAADSLELVFLRADHSNMDATVSSRSSHSAADVWTTGSRALTTPNDYKADVTNLDATVSSRSTFDNTTDSAIVDVSSAQAGLIPIMTDSTWLSSLEARDGVTGSFGDSAQGWGATAAGFTLGDVADTVWQHPIDYSDFAHWLANDSAQAGWLMWNAGDSALFATTTDIADEVADSVWMIDFEAHDGVAGSFADSAQGWGATSASALDSTILSNILHRIVWGTAVGSGSDSSTAAQRDIGAITASVLALMADSVWLADFEAHDGTAGSFGDSAQAWSGSGAATWSTAQRDSVLAVIADAGKIGDIRDTVDAIIDTLQNQDDWVSSLVASDNIGINWSDVVSPGATVNLAATTVNAVTGAGVTSIGEGVIDSSSLNATFKYKFWAYDDSAALNLDQGLSQWMQDNLSGAASVDYARIADSVWMADFEAHDGVGGSFGDSAQGWGATSASFTLGDVADTVWQHVLDMDTPDFVEWLANDSAQAGWLMFFSGDTTGWADLTAVEDTVNAIIDSLQDGANGIDVNVMAIHDDAVAAGRFETMLDGTGGQTLSLGGLDIRSDSDTALVIVSTGADAVFIEGGTSGDYGMKILAGTGSNKPGLLIQGDGTGDGVVMAGGATDASGLSLQGSGSGFDLDATLNLDDLTGTLDASELGASAVDEIAAYAPYVVKGDVDAGTFAVSNFTSDVLTQGNNHWVLNLVHFFTGNLAGQTSIVYDFVAATDSILCYPAFTEAPVEGDSFKILPTILPYVSARTGFVLANATAQVGDVVWDKDTTDVFAVAAGIGKFIKDSTGGGGGGGTTPAAIWNYDGIADFQDSVGNDQAGQFLFSVGLHNVSHNAPTNSMKLGTGYDGTDGSNVEDDFDSLFADVAALSLTGGGTEPETLIVLDTADSTQIQGARITVRTIDQSTVKVNGLTTDVNGKRILELDSDSFFVATVHNNYTEALDTIVVAVGGQTDTVWVTPINPAAASAPNMCNVYFDTWAIVGDTVVGAKLEATIYNSKPPYRDSDSSVIMIPRKITAYTDNTGRATIGLVRSSEATDITGNNITYTFTLSKSNYFKAKFENRVVPDTSTWKGR